jgi:LacI family transcriptional regulator
MTVSRVVNGDERVREATRKAVQTAVAKLGYSPNLAARALAGAEPVRIGLLYSNPNGAFLSELLVCGLEQGRVNPVQLVVQKYNSGQQMAAMRELLATGVDGIILPPPLCDSKRIHGVLIKAGTPAVAVASVNPSVGILAVRIDDHAAALAMTRHILSLGHTRVGFIIGDPDQPATAARLQGYKTAMIEANIPLDAALIRQGSFTYRSGATAAAALLGLADPPTAIFASNDAVGAATVAVALHQHLEVPKDLTICGFEDGEFSRPVWPQLTTIRQPIFDMSRTVIMLLLNKIKARRDGRHESPHDIVLDFVLVRRHSDGPPRR